MLPITQLPPTTRRILLVDDEPVVRDSVRRVLEFDGHAVEVVASGAEALTVLQNASFDLVITDYEMPLMKGDELATAIKVVLPLQPVLMVSALRRAVALPDRSPASRGCHCHQTIPDRRTPSGHRQAPREAHQRPQSPAGAGWRTDPIANLTAAPALLEEPGRSLLLRGLIMLIRAAGNHNLPPAGQNALVFRTGEAHPSCVATGN